MMLGIPSTNNNNGAAAAAAEAEAAAHDSGGGDSGGGGGIQSGGFSEDDMRPERGGSGGGNRWPRQETVALLKIRSDMDNTFRDSSLKGPLWDEVSRKMAELGFHRTAKKCKEKFENVFKYHKRTKEGRASKADGKTYRFFDQLEALEANPAALQLPPTPTPRAPPQLTGAPSQMPPTSTIPLNITVSSAPLSPNPVSFSQNLVSGQNAGNNPGSIPPPPPTAAATINAPVLQPHHHYPASVMAGMMSNSSSSSTSSDEEIERRHGRKRKWKDFFERLMKDVISKQEELQRRFLESLEKRERDRMVREEAWRSQELARMTREHDLLVQERSMAAAKDAAVIAFLQKVTDQQNPNPNLNAPTTATPTTAPIQIPTQLITIPTLSSPPPPPPQQAPPPPPPTIPTLPMPVYSAPPPPQPTLQTPPQPLPPPRSAEMSIITPKPASDNGVPNFLQPSPSRWPKSEVQALIKLRTNLDMKYQENGPKGPLWEEISTGMRKMGYNRNAKRCKEKWENINKYFKKVKESNKKRPQDSKTCPYFHQLEALYREKGSSTHTTYAALPPPPQAAATTAAAPLLPIMARPEQQWPIVQPQQPPQQQQHHHHQDSAMEEDRESDNMDENDHDDDDGDDDDDDDDEGGGYEMVTNKQASSVTTSAAE